MIASSLFPGGITPTPWADSNSSPRPFLPMADFFSTPCCFVWQAREIQCWKSALSWCITYHRQHVGHCSSQVGTEECCEKEMKLLVSSVAHGVEQQWQTSLLLPWVAQPMIMTLSGQYPAKPLAVSPPTWSLWKKQNKQTNKQNWSDEKCGMVSWAFEKCTDMENMYLDGWG